GLLPIRGGRGAGKEVRGRMGAPMAGGVLPAPLFWFFIIPAAYNLFWLRRKKNHKKTPPVAAGFYGMNA
ncbi:hypothetical protein, partial [Enterobacter roggenkampii]|uniref:hypothetical protein n=1 Tax=Enterobacter roggenkampii TaxID=1812935 RepID=UPI002FF5943C